MNGPSFGTFSSPFTLSIHRLITGGIILFPIGYTILIIIFLPYQFRYFLHYTFCHLSKDSVIRALIVKSLELHWLPKSNFCPFESWQHFPFWEYLIGINNANWQHRSHRFYRQFSYTVISFFQFQAIASFSFWKNQYGVLFFEIIQCLVKRLIIFHFRLGIFLDINRDGFGQVKKVSCNWVFPIIAIG